MIAMWNGVIVAHSTDTIRVEGYDYFPPSCVDWGTRITGATCQPPRCWSSGAAPMTRRPPSNANDALTAVLFDTRRGYCQQVAGAFAARPDDRHPHAARRGLHPRHLRIGSPGEVAEEWGRLGYPGISSHRRSA